MKKTGTGLNIRGVMPLCKKIMSGLTPLKQPVWEDSFPLERPFGSFFYFMYSNHINLLKTKKYGDITKKRHCKIQY